jgi:hypothetical protein
MFDQTEIQEILSRVRAREARRQELITHPELATTEEITKLAQGGLWQLDNVDVSSLFVNYGTTFHRVEMLKSQLQYASEQLEGADTKLNTVVGDNISSNPIHALLESIISNKSLQAAIDQSGVTESWGKIIDGHWDMVGKKNQTIWETKRVLSTLRSHIRDVLRLFDSVLKQRPGAVKQENPVTPDAVVG